jgi:hypothetical protein
MSRANPYLSDDALAAARAVLRPTLTSFATIERPTTGSTAGGGANTGAPAWTGVPNGTNVECAISPLVGGQVPTEASQSVALNRWRVRFDYCAPAVGPGYRLTISGVDAAGGAWTRVVVVLGEHTPRTVSAARVYVCEDAGPGRR